jgi:hypothetical protein
LRDAVETRHLPAPQAALRPKALAALDKLHRARIGPSSQGDPLQLYLALGERATAMQMLPGMCAAIPVGCGDLAINPMYAPLHGVRNDERREGAVNVISGLPAREVCGACSAAALPTSSFRGTASFIGDELRPQVPHFVCRFGSFRRSAGCGVHGFSGTWGMAGAIVV